MIQATPKIRAYNNDSKYPTVLWGGKVNERWWRLALWRADRPESSTVEGRARKQGEKRGRKPSPTKKGHRMKKLDPNVWLSRAQ